jgi:hypothetical protein
MFSARTTVRAILLACGACLAGTAPSPAAEEREAMELGGYVTVDYRSDLGDFGAASLDIGEVDLGANVNISSETVASVVIKTWSRLDSLWIDQALVSYKPAGIPMELLFGQQTMSHGLLTTRLISDPSILDMVELVKPGVVLSGTLDRFTGGLGFIMLSPDRGIGFTPENLYSTVVNIDASLPGESLLRLSSLVNNGQADLDLAGTVNAWKLALDFEGFTTLETPDSLKRSGFYAGTLFDATERLGLAVRADGVSNDNFEDMDLRVAGGITLSIKDGIFVALEGGRLMPAGGDASNEIALEVGLEQTIKLPGFQRKTLTRE